MDFEGIHQFTEQGGIMFNFDAATVAHSNLGGHGPQGGPEHLLYENVGTYQGEQLDLKVVADPGYMPKTADDNGMKRKFGQINMMKGTASVMQFTVLGHDSQEPVTLPLSALTIWDFDEGRRHGSLTEMATVTPMAGFFMRSDSLVTVGNLAPDTYSFASTVYGDKWDNPKKPTKLTDEQQRKVVAVTFAGVSTWNITFAVAMGRCNLGRNFLFGGTIPTLPYTPSPCQEYTPITFDQSTVMYNNLAGQGPTTGSPEGIKYSNVGSSSGDQVDLVVRAYEDFGPYRAHSAAKNGLNGELGNLNFRADTKVRLNFTFVTGAAEQPVELGRFFITFLDIDMTRNGAGEALTINSTAGDDVHGYAYYSTSNATSLVVNHSLPAVKFSSSLVGTEETNPTGPRRLDRAQMSAAVSFFFKNPTSSFGMVYEVSRGSWAGRNLLFGGGTVVACAAI